MSLDRAYEDDNVFARIVRGELPCAKVHEDEHTLAFMDAYPEARGHTLIIPKGVPAVNLLDLPREALERLIVRTQLIAGAVVDALGPKGVRIAQFNGAAAGQSVFHVHFHVVPVYVGEAESAHGAEAVPVEELQQTAALIRARLSA